MPDNKLTSIEMNPAYDALLQKIGNTLENGRQKSAAAVNTAMVQTYWEIGRQIVEYEQNGNEKAEYGSGTLKQLSRDLTERYGKGFSWSNVYRMREMYLAYPIFATVSQILTWSHYVELLKIDDPLERSFYEKECINEHWGVRELKRQMKSMFFLELGKGFTYVGRQQKIAIGGRIYKVDLVFYHRILKCFVLIDLKRGEVQHEDIGQMNFYFSTFFKCVQPRFTKKNTF